MEKEYQKPECEIIVVQAEKLMLADSSGSGEIEVGGEGDDF